MQYKKVVEKKRPLRASIQRVFSFYIAKNTHTNGSVCMYGDMGRANHRKSLNASHNITVYSNVKCSCIYESMWVCKRAFIVEPVANKVFFKRFHWKTRHVNGRNKLFLRLPDQAARPVAAIIAANPLK